MYAMLDIDDTDYEGPETATIMSDDIKGKVYYYVYNYSDDYGFATSKAHVDVYKGAQLLDSYDVPTDGSEGEWWKVCSYNFNSDKLTGFNTIVSDKEFSAVEGDEFVEDAESAMDGVYVTIRNYPSTFDTDYYKWVANHPVDAKVGIIVYGPADKGWSDVKESITLTQNGDYTYEWRDSDDPQVQEVLAVKKDGEEIGYYNVFYRFDSKYTFGSRECTVNSDDQTINYTADDIETVDVSCSDDRLTAKVIKQDGQYLLEVCWKNTDKLYTTYYIDRGNSYYYDDED